MCCLPIVRSHSRQPKSCSSLRTGHSLTVQSVQLLKRMQHPERPLISGKALPLFLRKESQSGTNRRTSGFLAEMNLRAGTLLYLFSRDSVGQFKSLEATLGHIEHTQVGDHAVHNGAA